MEKQMDNLNEAMARRAADLETINNRINTLKTHYDELYMKLDTVMKVHPDYFEKSFTMIPSSSIEQNESIKDELEKRAWFLNNFSKIYVKHMNQYEQLKDNHPELFK
jgi:archaellum component FlaC